MAVDVATTATFALVLTTYSFSYVGSVDEGAELVWAWEGWEILIPIATVALVAVRRRAPWSVLVGLTSLEWFDRGLSIGSEPFGVAVGLFTIAVQRRGRETAVAVALSFAVLVASTQLIGRTPRGFWICSIVYAFGAVAGLAVRRIEAFRWQVLRLLAETRIVRERAQHSEERAALALEVHDVCSNSLAVVSRLSEAAAGRCRSDPDAARDLLAQVGTVARDGMVEVRRFVRMAESDPVDGDVETIITRMRAVGLPISATVSGEPGDQRLGATVYRVLQEALTNVLRHAVPTRIDVDVRFGTDGGATLSVVNDGVPPRAPRPGRGTRGMVERVATLGGALRTAPGPQVGSWSVVATVPAPHDRPTGHTEHSTVGVAR